MAESKGFFGALPCTFASLRSAVLLAIVLCQARKNSMLIPCDIYNTIKYL